MNNPDWMTLVSSRTVKVFSKEEDIPSTTIQLPSDVHSREEPVSDHSSWKELKKATLNEDYIEEDILLTSNGEVSVSSSTASRFNYDDMKTYGCKPLKDESGIVNCKECSKKVLPHGFINHSVNCEKIKVNASETTQNVDVSTEVPVNDVTINKNTKNPTSETYSSNKKRKKSVASEVEVTEQSLNTKTNSPASAKVPPEKKQKVKKEKEKKKTTGRNKGPIDLDRQCGVVAPPNNTPCARSLTCKSHSMALKRGVMGRSQSYDVLLAAYQKKSIGRPQNNGVQNSKQDNAKKDGKAVVPDKDEGVLVDSEEEVDAVMKAIINDMLPEGIA